MPVNTTFRGNFSAGEVSEGIVARPDLDITLRSSSFIENYTCIVQGGLQYRNGTRLVHTTHENKEALLVPFTFNDEQGYLLELTDRYARILTTEGPIVKTDGTLVGFTTPYEFKDISTLMYAQNGDTLTLASQNHLPGRITRRSDYEWTYEVLDLTKTHFGASLRVYKITKSNQALITIRHGDRYDETRIRKGSRVYLHSATVMTGLNKKYFILGESFPGSIFELKNLDGSSVDTTGYASDEPDATLKCVTLSSIPRAVVFKDSRLTFGGSELAPLTLWGSKLPDNEGVPRYDEFKVTIPPDDATDDESAIKDDGAYVHTLSGSGGKAGIIQWLSAGRDELIVGTSEELLSVRGGKVDEIITPTGIKAKSVSGFGSKYVSSIAIAGKVWFVQSGGTKFRELKYSLIDDTYVTEDLAILNKELLSRGVKSFIYVKGTQDVMWVLLEDGNLLGMTYLSSENVSGWHRHKLGGTNSKVISIGKLRKATGSEILYLCVERLVGGQLKRTIEYITEDEEVVKKEAYWTGSKENDEQRYSNHMCEAQKRVYHLDSHLVYDGSLVDTNATLNLTESGSKTLTISSTSDLFTVGHKGREIWKKLSNKDGKGLLAKGRCRIGTITDSRTCVGNILVPFDTLDSLAPGQWYLTTDELTGLEHLEGETVGVITDGGVHPNVRVTNGRIKLNYQTSYAVVGLPYKGRVITLPLNGAGVQALSLPKSIQDIYIRLENTLGLQYGVDPYALEALNFRTVEDLTSQPPPLYTGVKRLTIPDGFSLEKKLIFAQDQALPCKINYYDVFGAVEYDAD